MQHLTVYLYDKSPVVLSLQMAKRGNILSFYQYFIPYYELIFITLLKVGWNNGKHFKILEVIRS